MEDKKLSFNPTYFVEDNLGLFPIQRIKNIFRDEEGERKKIQMALEAGYDKGVIDTRKKFAAELERNDNFRISAFALGNHISQMAGNPYEKVEVIVLMLGSPSAKILSSYIRSENKKIIDTKPTFYQIKQRYLENLNVSQLRLIDEFLQEVVSAGDYNSACSNFYNNDWKNYLNWRS